MFGLLSPAWLLGAAAVIVPVAIHLFSRKEARRLRIGSLARLEAAAPRRVRRLGLTDVPLLLLRAAVLVLLALALARPVWRSAVPGAARLVVSPASLPLGGPGEALRDSLVADGYRATPFRSGDYWSELRRFDRQLGPGSRIAVIAPTTLANLRGARPHLSAAVTWFDVGLEGDREWIEDARRAGEDSVRVVVGRSDRFGTTFARRMTAGGAALPARHAIVVIAHDSTRAQDAAYVRAAVMAAAEYAAVTVDLALGDVDSVLHDRPQAIFWLSSAPVPPAVRARVETGALLVRDARSDRYERVDSPLYGVGIDEGSRPVLLRRAEGLPRGAVLWSDAWGTPVLTAAPAGSGMVYEYGSRLHPSWSGVVLQPVFVEMLVGLLSGARDWTADLSAFRVAPEDRRRAGTDQAEPIRATATPAPAQRVTFLHVPFLLLALGAFGLERVVATRRDA